MQLEMTTLLILFEHFILVVGRLKRS